MRIRSSRSRASRETVIGTRPINSGIIPNFTKSCGSASFRSSLIFLSFSPASSALNPMEPRSIRFSIIRSIPSKAPPQINRMLVVSIGISSCCGCFLPPCGGTDATVPSRIFNKACCTPSPETSLVIDAFSDLRVILSISSI